MTKYKKGRVVKGLVTGIESYGIFVSFYEFYSGLIHISEISHGFVRNINDYVKMGDTIYTEILEVDEEQAHLKLSIKNISYKNNNTRKNKKINETPMGFTTLEYKLPKWIEEKLTKLNIN